MRNRSSDGSVRRVRDERSAPSAPPSVPETVAERRELRVGVKAYVTDRDRVLLVEERRGDGSTFWTLPGGGVERGESFAACLRRELREEIRCPASVGERVGHCVYRHTSRPATTVYAILEASLESAPEPNPRERVLDHAWRAPTDLPPATLDPVERFVDRSMTAADGDR